MSTLYYQVRIRKNRTVAWRSVQSNSLNSKSIESKKGIKSYSLELDKNLDKICKRLQKDNYQFGFSKGVIQKKRGKKPRPLVISSIDDRIVQRSILEVLLNQDEILKISDNPYSFGGIRKKGVCDAISVAYNIIKNGATYYIKSDIKEFFRNIPRFKVLKIINTSLRDNSLNDILERATEVNIIDSDRLDYNDLALFPKHEIGVAQGYCLSPLFGNLLLNEFDSEMNKGDVRCLRYIDDFMILGSNNRDVHEAFKKGLKILRELGLEAHKFGEEKTKAKEGSTKSVNFLGCDISTGLIKPEKKSKERLINNIKEGILKSKIYFRECSKSNIEENYKHSLTHTLKRIDDTLRAWGNHYSFCNSSQYFENIDKEIDEIIGRYIRTYDKYKNRMDKNNIRKILGVHLISKSKRDPIIN